MKTFRSGFLAMMLAATSFALQGCGDDPGEAFVPGDYVIGVMATVPSGMFSATEISDDIYGFGFGEITVNDDGTITGSATFTTVGEPVLEGSVKSLPDVDGETVEITGTVTGTTYEIVFDFGGDFEYTSTGTISDQGVLTGDFNGPSEFPLNGATGGVVQQGEVAVACGGFLWGDDSEPLDGGNAIFLLNGDTVFGILGSEDFFGVLTGEASFVGTCDIEGCMDAEGKIVAQIDYPGVPSEVTFSIDISGGAEETPGGTSWELDGDGDDSADDYHIEFGGNTGSCFGDL